MNVPDLETVDIRTFILIVMPFEFGGEHATCESTLHRGLEVY